MSTGGELLAARLVLIDELRPHVQQSYRDLADTGGPAELTYKASWSPHFDGTGSRDDITAALEAALVDVQREELARGVSLVGPHRDDMVLTLGELPARGYASHGESWSMALALRLASFELLRADGDDPVLVLDDVFAELDESRRERLASMVLPAEQVLVTAAVAGDVPSTLSGARFSVAGGEVQRE